MEHWEERLEEWNHRTEYWNNGMVEYWENRTRDWNSGILERLEDLEEDSSILEGILPIPHGLFSLKGFNQFKQAIFNFIVELV